MTKLPSPARKTPGYDPEQRADDLKRRFARVSNRALRRQGARNPFNLNPKASLPPVRGPSFWLTAAAIGAMFVFAGHVLSL